MTDNPAASPPDPETESLQRRTLATLMAVTLAGLCGAVAPVYAQAPGPDAQQADKRIALLPIIVHSSDDPVFLREGLADMLTARLDQAGGFEIIRVEDPGMATTSLRRALESGRSLGADFVLFGSFTRFGKGASLDMQCASTAEGDGKTPLREIFVHSGSIGDVIPDLDELVGKLNQFAATGRPRGASAGTVDAPPEVAESTDVAAVGPTDARDDEASTAGAVDDDLIAELLSRVESLEATVAELQAQQGASESP